MRVFNEEQATIVKEHLENGDSILLVGKAGSGKTLALVDIISMIPKEKSAILLEGERDKVTVNKSLDDRPSRFYIEETYHTLVPSDLEQVLKDKQEVVIFDMVQYVDVEGILSGEALKDKQLIVADQLSATGVSKNFGSTDKLVSKLFDVVIEVANEDGNLKVVAIDKVVK